MAVEREDLRDWHRIFGLLLTDFFTSSPFRVDVERDLSVQQQLFDVVIVRRGRGRFAERLPDGLDGLLPHNPSFLSAIVTLCGTITRLKNKVFTVRTSRSARNRFVRMYPSTTGCFGRTAVTKR